MQILDAFLAHVLRTNPDLTPEQVKSLRRLSMALSKLAPMLDGNENLGIALEEMVKIVVRGEAERSDTKVEGEYTIRYGDGIGGVSKIRISRNEIVELSGGSMRGIGIGNGTISSRSYGLLIGEVYQLAAKKILSDMTVWGHKVLDVIPLRPSKKQGRRIDDWVIKLSNSLRIPVEVKGSNRIPYFETAFEQIDNELKERRYALFVGFLSSKRTRRAIVTIVKRGEGLPAFRAKLKELVKKGD